MRTLLLTTILGAAALAQSPLVLRYAHTTDPRAMAEVGTVVRSTGEILSLTVDPQSRAMTVAGAGWQQSLAAWLFERLDRDPQRPHTSSEDFEIAGQPDPAVSILYPANLKSIQDLQELAMVVRSVTEIRRAFTYSAARAVIVRATPDEVAAAKWLTDQLDAGSGPDTMTLAGAYMRVFRLDPSLSLEQLHENSTRVRVEAGIRRMFAYNPARAVAVRGTADQIAQADKLFRDRGVLATR